MEPPRRLGFKASTGSGAARARRGVGSGTREPPCASPRHSGHFLPPSAPVRYNLCVGGLLQHESPGLSRLLDHANFNRKLYPTGKSYGCRHRLVGRQARREDVEAAGGKI